MKIDAVSIGVLAIAGWYLYGYMRERGYFPTTYRPGDLNYDPYAPGGSFPNRIPGPLAPAPPGATSPGAQAQIGSLSAGSGALATALGLSASAATAIAGGAGILAYLIIQKGLFRGGEEALYVNPARDEYKKLFAVFNPYRTVDQNGPGFYGLAWLLHEIGGDRGDALMGEFNRADSKREFETVTRDIEALLNSQVERVRELRRFAEANFPSMD